MSPRGKLGLIGLFGSGVLAGAGIVWYATGGSNQRGPQLMARARGDAEWSRSKPL